MSNIVEFLFEENVVRTVVINNETYFVAKDVTDILGYKQGTMAVQKHCKEKGTIKHRVLSKGGLQETICINEPNLYRLIVSSKMPKADAFEAWVFEKVLPTIRKTGGYNLGKETKIELPYYYRRYAENFHKVPKGYFSILAEAVIMIIEPLQAAGAKEDLLDRLYPDISQGRLFKDFVTNKGIDVSKFPKYMYKRPNEKNEYPVQCYPNELLGDFRNWVLNVWIPQRSQIYFKQSHPNLLPYLPKLLK